MLLSLAWHGTASKHQCTPSTWGGSLDVHSCRHEASCQKPFGGVRLQVQLHRYDRLALLQTHLHPLLGLILAEVGDGWNHRVSVGIKEMGSPCAIVLIFFRPFWLFDFKIVVLKVNTASCCGCGSSYWILQGQQDNKWQRQGKIALKLLQFVQIQFKF